MRRALTGALVECERPDLVGLLPMIGKPLRIAVGHPALEAFVSKGIDVSRRMTSGKGGPQRGLALVYGALGIMTQHVQVFGTPELWI